MRHRSLFITLLSGLACAAMAQGGGAFVENRGQWPGQVRFKADLQDAAIWCEKDGVLIDRFVHRRDPAAKGPHPRPFRTDHHVLRMRLIGSDPDARMEGHGVQYGAYNFFIGNDPARWARGAHAFSSFTMHRPWEGIDLRWRLMGSGLKYDVLIAPGADPAAIAFTYEAADRVLLRKGELVISTALGEMTEHIPLAYQEVNGVRVPIACTYQLKNGVVGFSLGKYDTSRPLIIDPTLELSTYSGSTTDNFGYSATYDDEGFLYAGSSSFGNGYPTTTGAYQVTWAGGDGQGTIPGTDMALTKFDTTGTFLIWSTMYGGSGDDLPHSLIVNDAHELIVLGTTGSPDLPTTAGAFDVSFGGGTPFTPDGIGVSYPNGADMVVARVSSDGTDLLGSTFLGGAQNDGHNSSAELKMNYADEMRGEILLAPNGEVIVVSCTQSTDFPVTPGAPQTAFGGGSHDAIVARFDPLLSNLLWGTFLGGSGADAAFNGELNEDGDLYICGGSASADLPTNAGALQPSNAGGLADAFTARYAASGSALLNCSYYGSNAYDQAYLMDLDQEGNVFLFGQTLAPANELIFNAPYNTPGSGQFIAKLDPVLSTLLIASRFGVGDGTLDISPTAFLVDYCDKLYVSGWGSNIGIGLPLGTTGMPITGDAYQPGTDGHDFYLAVFEVDMSSLYYGTYFGGGVSHEHVDGGTSRFDRRGRVYGAVCAGCGSNDDFPSTPNAWSPTNNSSNCNIGVFKFDFDAPLVIADPGAPPLQCVGDPVQFTNNSTLGQSFLWDFDDGQTSTAIAPAHPYSAPGQYWVTLTASNPDACNEQDIDSVLVTVLAAAPQLIADPDIALCGPEASITFAANSFGTASQFVWSTSPFFLDTLNAWPADSTVMLAPPVAGTYYVQASTPGSCIAIDQLVVSTSLVDAAISPDVSICADETAIVSLSGIDPGSTIVWAPADSIDSGAGTTSINVSPMATTEFTVVVTSPSGCVWNGTAIVAVSPIYGSSVGASVDQSIVMAGTTVQLNATPSNGVNYSWTPVEAVSNATIANPTAFVTQTTTFWVVISDGICTRSDSVTVTVYELNCDEPDIFIPDAFTPNGDGNNDLLFVRGRFIASMELKIFDRWGELVFETTDQAEGWDATYKGKPVDPAVFVYWLEVTCGDGQEFFKKGNVTVIR